MGLVPASGLKMRDGNGVVWKHKGIGTNKEQFNIVRG